MFNINVVIPCYADNNIINRALSSLATQWKREYLSVIMVNDCSPNTDCCYQDLVDRYKDELKIRVINMDKNSGQGLTRQTGIDACEYDWFVMMDNDDQYAPLAISQLVGAVESYGLHISPEGIIECNENGEPIRDEGLPEIAVVSANLLEFDDAHVHTIPNDNRIWLNAKLYNKKFLEKHNIRFNEAQSRHAEDYYWMSCFFHCLDNDPEYTGLLMDNNGLYYLWYPNEGSQSREDPHYGFMLSGYTMDGSVNILEFIKNNKTISWTDEIARQYDDRLLNMTVYSFFTFLSFIRHVASTDYIPKLEKDWYLLRDACNTMRKMVKDNWRKYGYIQKVEQLFLVKNNTDVQYTDPWLTFDEYIINGMDEFDWTFEELLKCKETYKFDESGVRIWQI